MISRITLSASRKKTVLTSNQNKNWKCFNVHVMLIATLCYSKFESIQLERGVSRKANESGNTVNLG